jgi:hypothetical protein
MGKAGGDMQGREGIKNLISKESGINKSGYRHPSPAFQPHLTTSMTWDVQHPRSLLRFEFQNPWVEAGGVLLRCYNMGK